MVSLKRRRLTRLSLEMAGGKVATFKAVTIRHPSSILHVDSVGEDRPGLSWGLLASYCQNANLVAAQPLAIASRSRNGLVDRVLSYVKLVAARPSGIATRPHWGSLTEYRLTTLPAAQGDNVFRACFPRCHRTGTTRTPAEQGTNLSFVGLANQPTILPRSW